MMVLALFLLGMTYAHGQRRLMLEHKRKPEKKKIVDATRTYEIQTADTAYVSKIATFSDSTLSVTLVIRTGDSTYTYSETHTRYAKRGIRLWKKRIGKDTTYTHVETRPVYRSDTLAVSFKDIRIMKKDWFKNTEWVEVIGKIAFAPLTYTPSHYAGSKTFWQVQLVTLAVCLPAIYIGTRTTKYDLVKKWNLKAEG